MQRITKKVTGDNFPQPLSFSHGGSSGIWWSPQPTWSERSTRERSTELWALPHPPPYTPQPFNNHKQPILPYSAAKWDRSSRLCAWVSLWLWQSCLIYACTPVGSKSFLACPVRSHELPQCLTFSMILIITQPVIYLFCAYLLLVSPSKRKFMRTEIWLFLFTLYALPSTWNSTWHIIINIYWMNFVQCI